MLGGRHEGEWKKVDYGVAIATAVKEANSTHITITSNSLGKRAEFDCKPGDSLYGVAIDSAYHLHIVCMSYRD